jgi:hypothetical protein
MLPLLTLRTSLTRSSIPISSSKAQTAPLRGMAPSSSRRWPVLACWFVMRPVRLHWRKERPSPCAILGVRGGNPRNDLFVFTNGSFGGYTSYGINADTYLLYDKGQKPRIDVFGDTAAMQGLLCTLSGY